MATKNENARVEMFSDGVFAIAITLLILEIKVPPIVTIHSVNSLWNELSKLWPSYFAFVLSFGFILVCWVNHHAVFNLLDKTSPQFMYINGFLLLTIVFIPFPTAMLAEYVTSDYAQPAVVFYCFSYWLGNIGWNLFYRSILKPMVLTKDEISAGKVKAMLKNARYGFVIYLFVTILAWWLPIIALVINTLLWILWIKMSMASLSHKKY